MQRDLETVARALAYCESHALQGADDESEAETVRWVADTISALLKAERPRFPVGEFALAAKPIQQAELRARILEAVAQDREEVE